MDQGYLSHIKRLTLEFIKYYVASVFVMGVNGELFNIALRIWSKNEMSFYSDGLWQISLILSFAVTCCVMLNKYLPK